MQGCMMKQANLRVYQLEQRAITWLLQYQWKLISLSPGKKNTKKQHTANTKQILTSDYLVGRLSAH
jgi:hypothetical protein